MNHERLRYYCQHWKQGVHFILRTKRFGVNNRWWSDFDSLFGRGFWYKIFTVIAIMPMIRNYRHMKWRAGSAAHMLTDSDYEMAFGEPKNKD